ncbi:3-hydroxyacyl-CoA dehydrogenase NAD-binding domain-containing protein [Streptomyces mirabilis]|jgi:3-hydroxyacyl-CoA dehydrogenase/enoyl-CoA hydratase/3-hydroxybutyryl-CoA epimerase|uniref:3-hydroxyacyl-CoA dehydrogenase / enoyl-CoA hydratase / 3-hydroxybutyryl-CoA epimerase n=1 Tax=Streptomyces mirabilis TaxID=68239 RepID=A0A1I2XNU6_9ACTN|nr:3-hydroxyacyl-CoA dehydrogenase NAD-binding domain-containing protein [Streptomyces mirabilis]SFH13761.1 3-hydroxyacyl-CoA dehydrogenase / enoyl-CoA hydratase / 3-hydroxybutyryl-CoA epimerase [Streptomyces mirabilis]
MTEQNHIRWEQGTDRIAVLTMDAPGQSANTMNSAFIEAFAEILDRLEAERDSLPGVVITSAKKTFFAGGDLNELIKAGPEDAADMLVFVTRMKTQLRRLENLGRPVVAALGGAALGGGLEIALACHHRITLDAKGSVFGLPEVTLGLLPGAGGVVRTVRLLGITDALTKVLLEGQRHTPAKALEIGLVDEVVATPEELLARARQWVLEHPDAVQPWDAKGYRIPGGTPSDRALAANLPAFPANLRKQLKGANYPAPRNILAAAVEGAQVDLDTAFTIESRYFVELVTGQISKNMTKGFFFDTQHINAGGSRPAGFDTWRANKVGVLGAGMMGAGIAYVCARGGMQVVLKDVSVEAAEKGKAHSARLLDEAVSRGRTTHEQADATLARITPTKRPADLADCDLVIEAVFESPDLKRQVFQEIQDVVEPGALLASNTSTLPITDLGESVKGQENFIGLHFFSPVDKMPLLEIVVGNKTSDTALARAFDVARQIGKTPIVVNDSRGFFTSRVIGRFLDEAVAMVGEGIHPASVEQAGSQAGYPTPPLQLVDELTLTLTRKIREEFKAATRAEGRVWKSHGSEPVIDHLIDRYDRKGRSSGAGFYDYTEGKRAGLWPGLVEHFTKPGHEIPFRDMQERMLFAEALETVRCFDEGVLRSVPDANVGSLLGIGFPAWTGGVIQYINQYKGGLAGFVARARQLAKEYGERFVPPASLVAKAERGETYG